MKKKTTKKATKKELADFSRQFRALNDEIRVSFRIMDNILEDLKEEVKCRR